MTATVPLTDPYVSHYAAADLLGCARQTVLAYAARGLLTAHRFGGHTYFERAQVEALAERLKAEHKRATRKVAR
jgi:excisionase family DNA binding protein